MSAETEDEKKNNQLSRQKKTLFVFLAVTKSVLLCRRLLQ